MVLLCLSDLLDKDSSVMLFFLKKKKKRKQVVNVSFQSLLSGGKVNPSSVTSHTYTLGPQEINFNLRGKKKLKKALAEKYDFSNPSRTNLGKATLFWNAYGCQSAAELESDQLLLAQAHLLLFTEKLHPGHPCRPGVKPRRS